ncbi:hypothetical protein JAAARDRAFT_192500 [Jaapia argillacea MUCL 33604]|uniref:Uncharacterized protein n=1 Tax=Jaapia argillacea MUCL 33604 TaxID=933084 RepID=A0A067PVV3_9AGAM|nr:hypothetical protein JAAARDRAFT_192500 [Jaapia argillacea MUCL 33604]
MGGDSVGLDHVLNLGGHPGLIGAYGLELGTGRFQDDFLLNPAPVAGPSHLSGTGLPPMSIDHLYAQTQPSSSHHFSFPPLYPQQQNAGPMDFHESASSTNPNDIDFVTRYRAQADLLRRAGVQVPPPPAGMQESPTSSNNVLPGLYSSDGQRYGLSSAAWPQSQDGSTNQNGISYTHVRAPQQYGQQGGQNSQPGSLFASPDPSSSRIPDPTSVSNSASPVPGGGSAPYPYAQQQQHHAPPIPHQGHPNHHTAGQRPMSSHGALMNHHGHRTRRESISVGSDYDSGYEYESSSQGHGGGGGGGSMPGSARSSNVHLPMLPSLSRQSGVSHAHTGSTSSAASSSHGHGQGQDGDRNDGGHGGFSSQFGLMSLDDPNVLAGLSSDAPPFFSSEAMQGILDSQGGPRRSGEDEPTPLAGPGGKLATGAGGTNSGGLGQLSSRELETRELREFWKQYMRTPLSGPGGPLGLSDLTSSSSANLAPNALSNSNSGSSQGGNGLLGANGRPSLPKRGLSRVVSLPSVKTPTGGNGDMQRPLFFHLNNPPAQHNFYDDASLPHPHSTLHDVRFHDNDHGNDGRFDTHGHDHAYDPPNRGRGVGPQRGGHSAGESNIRTTLNFGDKDDLRSYEEAVLARKGLTSLNLVPRKFRGGASGANMGERFGGAGRGYMGGRLPPIGGGAGMMMNNSNQATSRPSSAMSSTSGTGSGGSHGSAGSSSLAGALRDTASVPPNHYGSRPGTAEGQPGTAQSDGGRGGGSDGESGSMRPSVKRLASQTLGPEYSKRAQLSRSIPGSQVGGGGDGGLSNWGMEENAVADGEFDGDGDDGDDEDDGVGHYPQQMNNQRKTERSRRMSAPSISHPLAAPNSAPMRVPLSASAAVYP